MAAGEVEDGPGMTTGSCTAGGVALVAGRAGTDVGWTCHGSADGVRVVVTG